MKIIIGFCIIILLFGCINKKNLVEIKILLNKKNFTIHSDIQCNIEIKNNTDRDYVLLSNFFWDNNIIMKDNKGKIILSQVIQGLIIDQKFNYSKNDFYILKKGDKKIIILNAKIKKDENNMTGRYIGGLFLDFGSNILNLSNNVKIKISVLYDINKAPGLKTWIEKNGQKYFPGYEFLEYAESSNSVAIKIND